MNNQTIARKYLDYNNEFETKEDRAKARKLTARGKAMGRKIAEDFWYLGEIIAEGRAFMPHGTFMRWIDAEFGLSYSVARRFIRIFESFKVSQLGNFDLSFRAIAELAETNVSDETRAVALEMAASGDLTTTADAKVLIEAQNAHLTPSNSTELEADDDPFADEVDEDAEPSAMSKEEFEEAYIGKGPEAQIEDEDAPGGDEESDPPSEYFRDGETLETQASEESEPGEDVAPEPTLEEQLAGLPLAQSLALYGHNGVRFLQQASLWYQCENLIGLAVRKRSATRFNDGPVSSAVNALGKIPPPPEWEGCSRCKGALRVNGDPCELCQGMGFTVHKEQGVNADAVRKHAESFLTESV